MGSRTYYVPPPTTTIWVRFDRLTIKFPYDGGGWSKYPVQIFMYVRLYGYGWTKAYEGGGWWITPGYMQYLQPDLGTHWIHVTEDLPIGAWIWDGPVEYIGEIFGDPTINPYSDSILKDHMYETFYKDDGWGVGTHQFSTKDYNLEYTISNTQL